MSRYSYSTLKSFKKDYLIRIIRSLEHNIEALEERVNNQYRLLLEKDKYCWHDLRKDPNDLPKPMTKNVFVYANWGEHFRQEYGLVAVSKEGRWCDGLSYLDDVEVIAWKYCDLVPFEVEE